MKVVLRDTYVLLRLDIKNQEAFHRQIFKRDGVLWGVFVFQMCRSSDAFYGHILSHVNNTACKHLVSLRNA
jgi:hypothetical protein